MSVCPALVSQHIKTLFSAEHVFPSPHSLDCCYWFLFTPCWFMPYVPFCILLCGWQLTVSRWSWNCASNTVRKVGVELTWLRTGSFSTRERSFQVAELSHISCYTHRGASLGSEQARQPRRKCVPWGGHLPYPLLSPVQRLGSQNRADCFQI